MVHRIGLGLVQVKPPSLRTRSPSPRDTVELIRSLEARPERERVPLHTLSVLQQRWTCTEEHNVCKQIVSLSLTLEATIVCTVCRYSESGACENDLWQDNKLQLFKDTTLTVIHNGA